VPGFFDGDGQGGSAGKVWRVRFTPDEEGLWKYKASFRRGPNVAVSLESEAGEADSTIDGDAGEFTVKPIGKDAQGHFRTGRLEYVGSHYLKRRDGGYWLKGGTDSPENLLAYKGFDNTQTGGTRKKGKLLEFNEHASDWRAGDPDWDTPDYSFANDHDGRRIIGALNYLADRHVNSIYFLPMNVGGDGQDTHPWANVSTPTQLAGNSGNDNLHYDLSKLAQWDIVFRHAQLRDIHLHVVLSEAEADNKRELDNGTLGIERKLFYREMIARFAHHNALQWNVCEEFDLGDGWWGSIEQEAERVLEFADYISQLDAYHHPLTVHQSNHRYFQQRPQLSVYRFFLGHENFDLTSLQRAKEFEGWSNVVEAFRRASAATGRPLVIMVDEPESPDRIVLGPPSHNNDRVDATRRFMMWDIYLSGAGGVEWYINDRDQSLDHFGEVLKPNEGRLELEKLWQQTFFARNFVEQHLPFWEMEPDDDLVRGACDDYGGPECFAKPGEVYAVYLPCGTNNTNHGGPPEINLTAAADATFVLRWYDPRTGKFADATHTLNGGAWRSLGHTPDGAGNPNDWVALIKQQPPTLPADAPTEEATSAK
jgi:hypothetical protein